MPTHYVVVRLISVFKFFTCPLGGYAEFYVGGGGEM